MPAHEVYMGFKYSQCSSSLATVRNVNHSPSKLFCRRNRNGTVNSRNNKPIIIADMHITGSHSNENITAMEIETITGMLCVENVCTEQHRVAIYHRRLEARASRAPPDYPSPMMSLSLMPAHGRVSKSPCRRNSQPAISTSSSPQSSSSSRSSP